MSSSILHIELNDQLKKVLATIVLLFDFLAISTLSAQVEFAIPTTLPFPLFHNSNSSVNTLADLDGDGDLDLFYLTYRDDEGIVISYHENVNIMDQLHPEFSPNVVVHYQNIILPNSFDDELINCIFEDIDNDGDLDLFIGLLAYYDNSGVLFYENTGDATNPVFTGKPLRNPFGINFGVFQISVPKFGDIDNDGDLDLFTVRQDSITNEMRLVFSENIGDPESPNFGTLEENPFHISSNLKMVYFDLGDIDNDGDLDIIGELLELEPETTNKSFIYYQNLGDAEVAFFAPQRINPFSLYSIYRSELLWPVLGDLNNDGDLDILVVGNFDHEQNTASWFFLENLLNPVTLTEAPILLTPAIIYPTISHDFVTLRLETMTIQSYFYISIFDAKGRPLSYKSLAGGTVLNEKIDISTYPVGQYFIEIQMPDGRLVKQAVKQ